MVTLLQPNTDITAIIPDGQFKDSSPIATIEHIKAILKTYGLETEEKWLPTNVPYCYAVGVSIPKTIFQAHGKGLTREFALASAYGEFMERLQLGYINGGNGKLDGDNAAEATLWESVCAAELLEKNHKWYKALADRISNITGNTITPAQIIDQYKEKDGTVAAIPFFDLTNGTKEHLPVKLCKRVYTTNGSAAGNTPEESLVQGISEIVERNHQIKVFLGKMTLPDIPEEIIQKYTASYKIIQYVRSKGYRVFLKDASLGTKFPVVCACFINERTGRYHTHYGASPVFEIALERALTETFQGKNIDNFCRLENFTPDKPGKYSLNSMVNELMYGNWEKASKFFVGEPTYPYNPNAGFTASNNKELLRQCISYFAELGLNVLVRDSSCLGFGTYQVLIPGYSELYAHRILVENDDQKYIHFAAKTLRNPSKASMQDMLGLLMHMEQQKQITNHVALIHGFSAISRLPANLLPGENDLLLYGSMAYVYYALGQYKEVVRCIEKMIPHTEETQYLICLKRYLSALQSGQSQEQIKKLLDLFHTSEIVQSLYSSLANKQNPLDRFTLHCDRNCNETCQLFHRCCYERNSELEALLSKKTAELDFEAFTQTIKDLT